MRFSSFFNFIFGTFVNNTLQGSNRPDWIRGRAGDDTVNGLEGTDVVLADDGNDTVNGGGGRDFLFGGRGNDSIIGGIGEDSLYGGSGDDTLLGIDASGGGFGKGEIDKMRGGRGRDRFILGAAGKKYYDDGDNTRGGFFDYALIRDFEADGTDKIQLSGLMSDYVLEPLTNSSRPNSVGIFAVSRSATPVEEPTPSEESVLPVGPLFPVFPSFTLGSTRSTTPVTTGSASTGFVTKELIGVMQDVGMAEVSLSNSGQFDFVA